MPCEACNRYPQESLSARTYEEYRDIIQHAFTLSIEPKGKSPGNGKIDESWLRGDNLRQITEPCQKRPGVCGKFVSLNNGQVIEQYITARSIKGPANLLQTIRSIRSDKD
jgi:hypothetical protein